MPALAPLLASEVPTMLPDGSKRSNPRKLRRKNPPPSLSYNHQKLPSATSSIISLPKSRPASSSGRSVTAPSGGGWFSRKSMDASRSTTDERGLDDGMGTVGGVPTNPPVNGASQGSARQGNANIGMDTIPTNNHQGITGHFPGTMGKTMVRQPTVRMVNGNGIPPPIVSPRPGAYFSTEPEQSKMTRPSSRPAPIDDEFLLPPTAPFASPSSSRSSPSRSSTDSPSLPPLPAFQSGEFGFTTAPSSVTSQDSFAGRDGTIDRPPLSPKHPGRKAGSRSTSRSPQRPASKGTTTTGPSPPPSALTMDGPADSPADDTFHAVTAEEPIVLPTRASTLSSTQSSTEESSTSQAEPKKKERRSSFLGGWKLAMRRATGADVSSEPPSNEPPVGVGTGGGWIYRRRGSFSSPRPPSAEKAHHKSYSQEYKEFRASGGSSSSTGSSKSSVTAGPSSPTSANTFAARAAAMGVSPSPSSSPSALNLPQSKAAPEPAVKPPVKSNSTRKNFRDKMKSVEARFGQRNSEVMTSPTAPTSPAQATPAVVGKEVQEKEIVGLDVAVKNMEILERQIQNGHPPSPPDSREGDKEKAKDKGKEIEQKENVNVNVGIKDKPVAPLSIVKKNTPEVNTDRTTVLNSSPSPPVFTRASTAPGMLPNNQHKAKSLSPLRNQLDSSAEVTSKLDKGKMKEQNESTSSKLSIGSQYPPHSEAFSRSRTSSTGASRPPTPPKPVAKLFVICCRCKYWHDLPSAMYRGMVENGGATRCPYCLHGMETACCSGYTCVVYMHQRHH